MLGLPLPVRLRWLQIPFRRWGRPDMDAADHVQRLVELHTQMDQVYLALGVQSNHKPRPQPPKPVESFYQLTPGIDCHCCDFRNLPVEQGRSTQ